MESNTIANTPNSNAIIDDDALQKRYGGRESFIRKISDTFIRTHGETSDKIREAIATEDYANLRDMAHSIKGLSGYLEATELRRISEHAQTSTENYDRDALQVCAELAEALDRLVTELKRRT